MSNSQVTSFSHDLSISSGQSGGPVRSGEQVARYWKSRRLLRLWPVSGPNLWSAVGDFLCGKLDFDMSFVADIGQCHVERVIDPRSKVQCEVIVEFPTSAVRDAVKARGFKLEGKRAGIRIEIPHFLKSDFNVLQSVSYRMKMANSVMKRSVKFDDDRLGLYLDVQLEDKEWRRIRPDQARAARDSDPSLRDGPRELSSSMISTAMKNTQPARPPLSGANATPIS